MCQVFISIFPDNWTSDELNKLQLNCRFLMPKLCYWGHAWWFWTLFPVIKFMRPIPLIVSIKRSFFYHTASYNYKNVTSKFSWVAKLSLLLRKRRQWGKNGAIGHLPLMAQIIIFQLLTTPVHIYECQLMMCKVQVGQNIRNYELRTVYNLKI